MKYAAAMFEIDEAQVDVVDGEVDDAEQFAKVAEFRLKSTGAPIARAWGGGFSKRNPFADDSANGIVCDGRVHVEETPGELTRVPVSSLEKRLGAEDSHDQTTFWVEFWRPGGERPIHRSVSIFKKRGPVPMGVVGGAVA